MTPKLIPLILATTFLAAPAAAADLFDAAGRWVGTGSLATAVDRPMQPARCEVEVEQKSDAADVSVTGRCVVGAGASEVSFRVVRAQPGRVRGAMWSAAMGEVLQLSGTEVPGALDMLATTPWIVDGADYETKITVSEPDAESFAIRQLVRQRDADAPWRLLADMTYRQP